MRRPHLGERAKKLEARYIPEGAAVNATGLWHEGHASYPGSSVTPPLSRGVLPALQGVGMGRQMSAEAVVAEPIGEGLNMNAGWSPVLR
jgi:hypothetical protein